jgi:hypothetical protein
MDAPVRAARESDLPNDGMLPFVRARRGGAARAARAPRAWIP